MLTYMGITEGMVSGAIHSTGDTVRPALQIIKTKPGVSRTSGAFLMVRGRDQEKYLFSDCAINVNPTAQELAEIAVDSAKPLNYLKSIQSCYVKLLNERVCESTRSR